ncbi:hypothetical protein A2U01_0100091, partial [Trifolium medium]|nr:hypothetical protein [Trifolium medium]
PPKSLLLGIGVMTLGSSSCTGETFHVVFVIYEEVLAYGTRGEEEFTFCSWEVCHEERFMHKDTFVSVLCL